MLRPVALFSDYDAPDFKIADLTSDSEIVAPSQLSPPKIRKEFPETWIWDIFSNLGSV